MRKERGEAIVEFAILVPILFTLMFGLVDFGQTFAVWVVATNAAREGARYGSVYATEDYLTPAQVTQMAQQKSYDYLTSGLAGRPDVTVSLSDVAVTMPSKMPGQPVTVEVTLQIHLWAAIPFVPLPDPVTIHGQAVMQI